MNTSHGSAVLRNSGRQSAPIDAQLIAGADRHRKASAAWLRTPEFNIFIFSFLLNLAWEVWQVPYFRGMADQPHWLGVKACTQATFGDAGIALAAFWVTAIFAKTRSWILQPRKSDIVLFLGVGIVVTIVFEALATGMFERWAYTDTMPRLPLLGTGLLPLLQWLALPPLVLWFVRRQIYPGPTK